MLQNVASNIWSCGHLQLKLMYQIAVQHQQSKQYLVKGVLSPKSYINCWATKMPQKIKLGFYWFPCLFMWTLETILWYKTLDWNIIQVPLVKLTRYQQNNFFYLLGTNRERLFVFVWFILETVVYWKLMQMVQIAFFMDSWQ